MKKLITLLLLITTTLAFSQEKVKINFNLGITQDKLNIETSLINYKVITGVGTTFNGTPTYYFIVGYDILNKLQVTAHIGGEQDEPLYYANKVMLLLDDKVRIMVGVTVDSKNNGFLNIGYQF